MTDELLSLKERISEGVTDDLLNDLQKYASDHPTSDEVYFLIGNAHRRREHWKEAMNAYLTAVEINPESPARHAYRAIVEVLDFYNKDMYNQ